MVSFLPFALPDIGEEEIAEVVDTLRSGWITSGRRMQRFEADFAAYMGEDVHAVAVNSATAGLHLACEALGIGPGDEVIVPTYTFTATAEVVRYVGADVVLVDVDPDTLNIDPAAVEAAIGPRTKAIIVVHFAGLACDMAAIMAIARRHGLLVVEDAAHALPTTHGGRLIGTLDSDATVFSFYATKTLATGEGGMVVTRSAAIAERCRIMRLHGIDRNVFDRYMSNQPSWQYEVVAPGFKYSMPDLLAAIGLHQLRKVDRFHFRRAEMAARYSEALADLPLYLPAPPPPGDVHAWHLYVIRLAEDGPLDRRNFFEAMTAAGIGCSVHFIPLHLHPYWRDRYALVPEDFPVASRAFASAVSLPIYTRMRPGDQERVIGAVRDLLAARVAAA